MSTSRTITMRYGRIPILSVHRLQAKGVSFNSIRAYTTQKTRENPISVSHLVSGLVGGGVVIFGGYLFYHFSGIKPAVDTAVNLSSSLKNAKVQIKESPSPPNEALAYLRSLVKSQVVFIPGGSWAVDSFFNSIDELHNTHRAQIDTIIMGTYNDIKQITDGKGSLDTNTVLAILGVLRRRTVELGNVAGKASSDAVSPFLAKLLFADVRDALGGKWKGFRDYARSHGPQTKRIYDDAESQIVKTIETKGANTASVATILQILREKSIEAKRVAENTSWGAWEHAKKQTSPVLDKIPGVKKVLDENTSALIKLGGGVATTSGVHAREVWYRVKHTADSTGRVGGEHFKKLKNIISSTVIGSQRVEKSGLDHLKEESSAGGPVNLNKVIPGGQQTQALDPSYDARELNKTIQPSDEDSLKILKENDNKGGQAGSKTG